MCVCVCVCVCVRARVFWSFQPFMYFIFTFIFLFLIFCLITFFSSVVLCYNTSYNYVHFIILFFSFDAR